jgi:ElaB/YqjD/DUF883 family membrane-anchored ribosome-binding protein
MPRNCPLETNRELQRCLVSVTGEHPMTQQKAGYPIDYSKGSADARKDRLREMADVATDKVKNVTLSAEEIAGKVAEQAREYGEKAQEAAKNFKPYVEKSMKEQPMATLGVAAVIGFVLGALWKK